MSPKVGKLPHVVVYQKAVGSQETTLEVRPARADEPEVALSDATRAEFKAYGQLSIAPGPAASVMIDLLTRCAAAYEASKQLSRGGLPALPGGAVRTVGAVSTSGWRRAEPAEVPGAMARVQQVGLTSAAAAAVSLLSLRTLREVKAGLVKDLHPWLTTVLEEPGVAEKRVALGLAGPQEVADGLKLPSAVRLSARVMDVGAGVRKRLREKSLVESLPKSSPGGSGKKAKKKPGVPSGGRGDKSGGKA